MSLVWATIEPQARKETVSLQFCNHSSRPVLYWVLGVVPEVGIELEGNRDYSVQLPRDLTTTIVEVRRDGPVGETLTWAELPKWSDE